MSDPAVISGERKDLVLIPSFNTGPRLRLTVEDALAQHKPVWVVIDGSTDNSDEAIRDLEGDDLKVIRIEKNRGKGRALLLGAVTALREGFTHVTTIDADGQHPANMIQEYIDVSRENPDAMLIGQPVFDETAPRIRVNGRKFANFFTAIEVLGSEVGDSLFGMRLYPLEPFVQRMESIIRWGARRYDFDPEIAARLVWDGVPSIHIPTPVRYFDESENGVSHYRYLRDNLKMAAMHLRLLPGMAVRIPQILENKFGTPTSPEKIKERLYPSRIAAKIPKQWDFYYTLCKLKTDPLYEAVCTILRDATGPVLDVGCGLGLLGHSMRVRGILHGYHGFDFDESKIESGLQAAVDEDNFELTVGDAREKAPKGFSGSVTLLDMLQFLTKEQQTVLLQEAADWVAPGGVLIIRNCLDDGSDRFRFTRFGDRFSNLISWMKGSPHTYPTKEFFDQVFAEKGFTLDTQPLWGNTPFSNYLLVYRRT